MPGAGQKSSMDKITADMDAAAIQNELEEAHSVYSANLHDRAHYHAYALMQPGRCRLHNGSLPIC